MPDPQQKAQYTDNQQKAPKQNRRTGIRPVWKSVEKLHTKVWKNSTFGSLDAVEVQFVVEGLAVDPQQLGRLRLVAAGSRQRTPDLLLLRSRVAQ